MKISHHLVFLILAVSSVSRGQNDRTGNEDEKGTKSPSEFTTIVPTTKRETEPETPGPMPSLPSSSPLTPSLESFTTANTTSEGGTTEGVSGSKEVNENTRGHPTTFATVTKGTTRNTDVMIELPESGTSSKAGFVVLALIILVIIVLCVVLYFLRRISRTYSFDLHRPSPVNHHSEPTGTFEPVYLDDLDHPGLKDVISAETSPPPVANGTSLQPEENGLSEETAPQEQPDANGVKTTSSSDTSPPPGDDQADSIFDPLSSANLLFDSTEEQHNENNNNPSVCSSDPFVEINLDEPAWCDQFLNNPQASSSVIPFASFSLSSSPS